MREDDVILGVLPLAFDYGLYQMIMAFRMGARLVLERSFTFPAQVLKLVADERVTGFPGVPTIFAMLAETEDDQGVRSFEHPLRHEHRGGAAGEAHPMLQDLSRRRASSRCTASPSASAARTCRRRTSTASRRASASRSRTPSCGSSTRTTSASAPAWSASSSSAAPR